MTREFIQVTATRGEDFCICSNLGLMDDPRSGMTFAMAEVELRALAGKYAMMGYDIKWTTEPLDPFEVGFYANVG